jgi:hypothetical protein
MRADDHWTADRHCFGDDNPEALVSRRQDQNAGVLEERPLRRPAYETDEVDSTT